jgi:uncharacterized membrane protein
VLNNGEETQKIDILISGVPSSWTYSLKSGGWSVQQLAVLPGEKKTLNLRIDVPLRVNKGNHNFRVLARNFDELPLVVNVSEQGTFKSEFTSDQVNMQGHAKSNFTFSTKLKNMTGEKQLYSLQANAPRGWEIIFKTQLQSRHCR